MFYLVQWWGYAGGMDFTIISQAGTEPKRLLTEEEFEAIQHGAFSSLRRGQFLL